MLFSLRLLLVAAVVGATAAQAAAPSTSSQPTRPSGRVRTLARLVYEDHSNQSLKSVDLEIDDQKQLFAGPVTSVTGAKALNAERQTLVQLRESQGIVVAGVRDDDDGQFESGWVLIDSGVRYRDHGDHGHWSFKTRPAVVSSVLDKNQGNPAHVYLYEGKFFIANDQKNGYTRIDPALFLDPAKRAEAEKSVRFFEGGGNHITLAVAGDKVGYSAWIDGGGPNKGKVDVTPLTSDRSPKPAYSFHLPTGGIHGAAVAEGKVFFAPSDGVCWTAVDFESSLKPEEVQVQHVSLGKQDDKPRRTGAFTVHGRNVVFTTGKDTETQLAVLDARSAAPQPTYVTLNVKAGAMAVSPVITKTAKGRVLAFVFHDHPSNIEMDDQLSVIDLDPNRDGLFTDAAVVKVLAVGPSEVDGHHGHHAIAFDASGQYGFFTNPGSGTLTAIRLADLTVLRDFPLGGKPTALVAIGGRETKD